MDGMADAVLRGTIGEILPHLVEGSGARGISSA
jgi:hypothetical protein